jgi:hypothetical protein
MDYSKLTKVRRKINEAVAIGRIHEWSHEDNIRKLQNFSTHSFAIR